MKRAIAALILVLVVSSLAAAQITEEQKLVASDAAAGDLFGTYVSIDGDTVVVGAPTEDEGGADAGAAYVFNRIGTNWTEEVKLLASDAAAGDRFGQSVAIDGDTVVVGATGEDEGGSGAGAAYVYTRIGSTWSQEAKLLGFDAQAGDLFGNSVAIDGDTVVVGAPTEDEGGADAGAAYVYTRTGSTWAPSLKLTADDAQAGAAFGIRVSIDGGTVVVGAPSADAGAAYVYTRQGTAWTAASTDEAQLLPSDAEAGDQFGLWVSIDGDTVVVGAPSEDEGGLSAGAAYVYTRQGTAWTEVLERKILASDAEASDRFGQSVAIDGGTVVVGAENEGEGAAGAGAAYVYTRIGTTWAEEAKIIASDAQMDDFLGRAIHLDQGTAILGVAREDAGGVDAGAAYVFSGLPFTPEPDTQEQPTEFDQGLDAVLVSLGIVSRESQVLFTIGLVGVFLVAGAAAMMWASPGRLKNGILLGIAFLITLFMAFFSYVETWYLILAVMLGAFTVFGGPTTLRNTYYDIRDRLQDSAAGRLLRLSRPSDVMESEEEP